MVQYGRNAHMHTHVRRATLDFESVKTRARVTRAIHDTLDQSFVLWPMRVKTQAEIKRRFTLLFEGYRVLRNEQRWSTQRCIDNFQNILRADLDLDETALRSTTRSSWYAGA